MAWGVFVLISLLPPLFAGGLVSMGRLTSTLFPLFIALAAVLPPRAVPVLGDGVRDWARVLRHAVFHVAGALLSPAACRRLQVKS